MFKILKTALINLSSLDVAAYFDRNWNTCIKHNTELLIIKLNFILKKNVTTAHPSC